MEFRYIFDQDQRDESKSEIRALIQGDISEPNYYKTVAELEQIVSEAMSEYEKDKTSRKARLKKVWAVALLRDFIYANRTYKFIKGVGLNGLFIENYKSSVGIDRI